MQQTSLCPGCDYYNPIEEVNCVKCGTPLRKADFVVRDKQGRESVIRDVGDGGFAQYFLWLSFAVVSLSFGGVLISSMMAAGGVDSFLSIPAGKISVLTLLILFAIMAGEWKSGLLYRVRLVAVFYLAFLAIVTFLGKDVSAHIYLGSFPFPVILLTAELISVLFSITFLVSTRVAGSIVAPIMAFLGLYCTVSPISHIFAGNGISTAFLKVPQALRGVPWWFTPSFLIYHVFLPYTLFVVIGSALRALLQSMEKVDGTKSIVRFLNRRKEEARGELLNIFIVGITLFTGFSIMRGMRVPNLISLIEVSVKRFL